MKIGIWCDYGFTLGPTEGIGVFVDNLARGLVRASPDCQVRLMAHPGKEYVLDSTVAGGLGRIEVVSSRRQPRLQRSFVRFTTKLRRRLQSPTAERTIAYWIDCGLERIRLELTKNVQTQIETLIQSCDLWLLPYVGLDQKFPKPTVVVIHDLVSYHFPDMLSADKLLTLKKQVARISGQSTIAACMSKFIRDNDLLGTLGLPPERIRVIPAAVPDDITKRSDDNEGKANVNADWLAQNRITKPYLLYPAAFRPYKNHRYLVDGLHILRTQNTLPLQVVFTGIHRCPSDLRRQIDLLDLDEDVVVLGKVSRTELKHLYQNALATIVPSLYEQGSFPIMESLACRCPVAASNIPSLREQFSPLGDSMFYFDPHQPGTLVSVVNSIQANRDAVIEAQSQGFSRMKEYTWESAARRWLEVFEEALNLGEPIETLQTMRTVEAA